MFAEGPTTTTTTMQGIKQHQFFSESVYRAKTVCTSWVLATLGIDPSEYRYSGTERQMMGIARRRWSCRSVLSRLPKASSVGKARPTFRKLAADDKTIRAFIVFVPGHVIMVDLDGKTMVDTAPVKRDLRVVKSVYAVRGK